jgi:hypothetical protein
LCLGTFKEGIHDGYVLKELCEYERDCCQILQHDVLKNFVPKYNGTVKDEEGKCKKRFSIGIFVTFFFYLKFILKSKIY